MKSFSEVIAEWLEARLWVAIVALAIFGRLCDKAHPIGSWGHSDARLRPLGGIDGARESFGG